MSATMRSIRQHVLQVASWVDPDNTYDQIRYGDPDRPVHRIGTGWSPCAQNLEAAAADGCDLFVSHEWPFYGNWAPGQDCEDSRWGRRRIAAIENSGMAYMNLHDTWDNFPRVGIRDSWRRFLGLGKLLAERPYHRRNGVFAARNSLALCAVKNQTLREFAQEVAGRTSVFPCSHGVTVSGDLDAAVTRVATGVGCHIPSQEMLDLGADVLVLTFDRAFQTTVRLPLLEMGANLITVEHGIAEMPGMQAMAGYLKEAFPGIEATFYCEEPQAVTFTSASIGGTR